MKKLVALLTALLLALCMISISAAESATVTVTLAPWEHEAGWLSFSAFAQSDVLLDAWETGAKHFAPILGIENLDGEMLRAMNAQMCGFEDGIVALTVADNSVTASDESGNVVFSYTYSCIDTLENAIDGATAYVFETSDENAGKYHFLCMTLPDVASAEGGVITNFNLRYTEKDYKALFADEYEGVTCILVRGDTTLENMDYTIRLIYGGSADAQ